jgi:hypothetical protein
MSVGYGTGYYDPYYDYYYRGGIYDHHHNGYDRPTTLPDRPRPPTGAGPNRPTTLPARAPGRKPR